MQDVMLEFIDSWGYLGVFLGILATGLGLPMPEELPIILGGVLTTHDRVSWYLMLPVCIVGVIIGDSFLYLIGRFWGTKLVELPFIRNRLLTPARLAEISENFRKHGVKILLFARLTPGIRAPIFFTAGITKLPIAHFLIADAIYAVPGVSILFWLGYWFTDSIIDLVKESAIVKPIIVLVVLAGVIVYVVYKVWKKPVVTGSPKEMPPVLGPVTEKLENVAESVAGKVMQRGPELRPAVIAPKVICNVIGRGLPPKLRGGGMNARRRSRPILTGIMAKRPAAATKKRRTAVVANATLQANGSNGQVSPSPESQSSPVLGS